MWANNLYFDVTIPIRNWFYIWKNRAKLKRAKNYAIFLSEQNNGRKYIVMRDYDGSFAVMNRNDFLLKRRRGIFVKSCKWENVVRDANYVTQYKKP